MPSKNRIRPQNRIRAYKPRVRTGCITCRIRRVKCDEIKPNCQRCASTGRKCDGYLNPPSSSLTRQMSETQFIGSDIERRSFDFFCKRTIVILSGVFNPSFWTRLVLQATHHEPAIRHGVIALGALHESSEAGSGEEQSTFAIQQYTKAIGSLVKPIQEMQKQAADVALITCVLFVCFETMRGQYGTAIRHIEGGVKIISELQPSTKPTETWSTSSIPYVEPSIINPIFLRLDRQASEMSSGRKRLLLDQILDDKASGYHQEIPLIFTSVEQARNSLDHMRTFGMRFIKAAASQPEFADPVQRKLKLEALKDLCFVKTQQWTTSFEPFAQNISKFDVTAQEAIHVLIMHHTVISIVMLLDEDHSFADATVMDQYEPQYKSIISHGAAVIKLHTGSSDPKERKRSVHHLDYGISFPLIFVAGSCRDGAIRREAIELMKATNRQEGILNSILAAMVCERMVKIEEEGLVAKGGFLRATEVPRGNRLGGMQIRWETDRCARLSYCRQGRRQIGGDGYEGGSVVVEETIEW